jgi:hypothetical protein
LGFGEVVEEFDETAFPLEIGLLLLGWLGFVGMVFGVAFQIAEDKFGEGFDLNYNFVT